MSGIKINSISPIGSDGFKIDLVFVAGLGDPDYKEPEYQRELHDIYGQLKVLGGKVQAGAYFQKSDTGGSWLTGDFVVQLLALGSPLSALLGVWITAKLGRRVRVKVGDIEVEAGTIEEVEQLLDRVRKIEAKGKKAP